MAIARFSFYVIQYYVIILLFLIFCIIIYKVCIKYIQRKGRGKMTNIKHLTERKVEIQFDPEKKVEHLILLVYKYKADHVYDKSTNTLMIECKTDTDMLNLLEEVKKYLRKA